MARICSAQASAHGAPSAEQHQDQRQLSFGFWPDDIRRRVCETHALQVGEIVTVFAYSGFGPFIEGIGFIDSSAAAADHYWVRFDDDPVARLRLVQAEWQASPDRVLAILCAFWRSNRSNPPNFDDFFPDGDI
jgi:hypothetical protein